MAFFRGTGALSHTGGTIFLRFSNDPFARLALALGCSLALHLALLFSFRLPSAPLSRTPFTAVFSARLQAVTTAPPAVALVPTTVVARRPRARKRPSSSPLAAFRHHAAPRSIAAAALAAVAPAPVMARATFSAVSPPAPPTVAAPAARAVPVSRGSHGTSHPPVLLQPIRPVYPTAAQADGVEGKVVVELQITATGVVRRAWVIRAVPPEYFEMAALAAVRVARFAPARAAGGVAVASRLRLTINFVLNLAN